MFIMKKYYNLTNIIICMIFDNMYPYKIQINRKGKKIELLHLFTNYRSHNLNDNNTISNNAEKKQ